jgi:hypothetical protein
VAQVVWAPRMAIDSRAEANGQIPGGIIHGDHATQFTSWTFTDRARRAGLLPSLGSVGDPYDNAVAEAFWARLQVEVLNRRRWTTRVELADAIGSQRHDGRNCGEPGAVRVALRVRRPAWGNGPGAIPTPRPSRLNRRGTVSGGS